MLRPDLHEDESAQLLIPPYTTTPQFHVTLHGVKDEMAKHFASGLGRTEDSLSAMASSLEGLREEQVSASGAACLIREGEAKWTGLMRAA